jgi:hypothetical protein
MLRPRTVAPTLAAAILLAAYAPASDPVGVYGLIDKVVVESDGRNPERIQIWGVFMLSDGKTGDNYLPPQHGYLYYATPDTPTPQQRAEWNDLRSVAGTGTPVGFAGRYERLGRVRPATDAPANPDAYPRSYVGIVKVLTAHFGPDIARQLKEAAKPVPPKR